MRWAWKIGRLVGIDVYMHATFLLLVGFIVAAIWARTHNAAQTLSGALFVLVVFSCIVLHELGHALAARRYGIRTRDIVLLPIGGMARLERVPKDPIQELMVALAGPAVNVVIAASLFIVLGLVGRFPTLHQVETISWTEDGFLPSLMVVNVWLVLFNLLPAFPMDGGRVLRALLAKRMNYPAATQAAANVGQTMAVVFGFLGLFYDPFLLFIALFVWIGAGGEAGMVQMHASLEGISVERVMFADFQTLQPGDTLAQAVKLVLSSWQQDFPVVFGTRALGVLTRKDLVRAIGQGGRYKSVQDAMRRDFQTLDLCDPIDRAVQVLERSGGRSVPVESKDELVGMLTLDKVREFMTIRSAVRQGDQTAQSSRAVA